MKDLYKSLTHSDPKPAILECIVISATVITYAIYDIICYSYFHYHWSLYIFDC